MFGFIRYKTAARLLINRIANEAAWAAVLSDRECIAQSQRAMFETVHALAIITPGQKRSWLKNQLESEKNKETQASRTRDYLYSAVRELDESFRINDPHIF